MMEGAPIQGFMARHADGHKVITPYQRIPQIGQSIGAQPEPDNQLGLSSGSLGLYINLSPKESPNLKTTYALTCNHVAFSLSRPGSGKWLLTMSC